MISDTCSGLGATLQLHGANYLPDRSYKKQLKTVRGE